MIFKPSGQDQRLKWVFSSCKNGAWGTEPDGESDVVCIRAADFDGRLGRLNNGKRTLRSVDPETYEKLALRQGDIILEKSGGGEKQLVGRAAIFDGKGPSITSNFLARCRPTPNMDPAFINYLLLAIYNARGTFPNLKQSTGIQNLDLVDFLNVRVSIPPLGTQRRIARFLDEKTARIDGLIEKKRELLDRLAEKRHALITGAVTKGLNPDAQMKSSSIDWIGDIPAHWEVLPLKRVLASSTYGISASLEPSGEIAVLRMGNLVDGEIDFGDLRFLDEIDEDLLLKVNDVVFNRTNSLDLVGKASIFRGSLRLPVSFASYLVRFRFADRYNPEYANFVMGTRVLMALGRTLALPSIGQANLSPSRYALIEFPIPPKEEQSEIVAHLTTKTNELGQVAGQVSESIEALAEYRSALIIAGVTGQLLELR